MGKKSPPPKPPDLTPVVNAQVQIAEQSNELAREYLGISREQFAWMKENATAELELARQQADKMLEFQNKAFESDEEMKAFSRQVGQAQIDAMQQQMGYAAEDRARWNSVFVPLQDKLIADAKAYDTPERRAQAAAEAQVDVQRQAEAARNNADARLRSMGLDPSQMRSSSMMDQMSVATAANQALAGNMARTQVEDKGRALMADAVNMGNGLPASAVASLAGSANSGNVAVNAASAGQNAQLAALQGGIGIANSAMGMRSGALSNLAALTGSPMQWAGMGGNMYGQASSAYGNAANTMNSGYQNQMQHWQAGQQQSQQAFNNIMSVGSLAAGMFMAEGGDVDKDKYIRKGKGRGKDGALNMRDRLENGMAAASSFSDAASNVWDEPMARRGATSYADLGGDNLQYAAEGGGARGALPVRQARDKIPAFLAEGEYVVPADVVRSLGVLHFDKLVKKYHRENA